jgi:hypothetical protein
MLTKSLWRDEAWVAVSLRAPVWDVVKLTSSTPVLFTAALRVVPHSSPAQLRALPLAFAAITVVPAWLLGREVDPGSRVSGRLFAIGVAFAPTLVLRQDLKQYTAEAFDSLIILWMVAALERRWSRRRLVALGVVLGLSTFLSNPTFFLAPGVFLCLGITQVFRRDFRRLRDVAGVGLASLLVCLLEFLTISRRGDTPSLRAYWDNFYIPTDRGVVAAARFVKARSIVELHAVGLGPSILVLFLLVVGLWSLARGGFPALALVIPTITIEQVALAGTHTYPLWDIRTSTWFTLILFVLAINGTIALARLLLRSRPTATRVTKLHVANTVDRWPLMVFRWLAVAVLCGAVAVPYFHAVRFSAAWSNPDEDAEAQVQAILAGWHPGDVVVANVDAGFGLGVYWPTRPLFLTDHEHLITFRIGFPAADRVVVAVTQTAPAEVAAVQTAVAMATAAHGRVWVMFSHWHASEKATMLASLRSNGTLTIPAGQTGEQVVQLLTLRKPG